VGPRAGRDAVEKRKIFYAGNRSRAAEFVAIPTPNKKLVLF
jgi:hypothetical protein